ncbi:MAG: RimK/LysX family protein [Pseudomonadota bacterium]|nr:RimK/LysX family protein [Pseudomonadota bacterium]
MDTRSTFKPDVKKRAKGGKKAPPTLIGWREWAAFPDLGAERIKAKIDTGAKTSAVHAYRIRTEMRGGVLWAEFYLHPVQKKRIPEIKCSAPVIARRKIRSSNGVEEVRNIIETTLRMGGREWRIQLSLARRDEMGFRLLLGRDAIRKKFIIDPAASFLLGR